jgi:hypothetical protein
MKPFRTLFACLCCMLSIASGQSWSGGGGNLWFNTGNVGIGTSTPTVRLSLGSAITDRKLAVYQNGSQFYGFGIAAGTLRFEVPSGSPHKHVFFAGSSELMTLHDNGKLQIGNVSTASNDYLLFVKKGIATGKVFVNSSYADYVFLPDYPLPTLEEVRSHILRAGHLPGMTSQAEIDAAGGFEVGAIAVKQMEKIEELYLYVLQLHDRMKQLETKLAEFASDTPHSHE